MTSNTAHNAKDFLPFAKARQGHVHCGLVKRLWRRWVSLYDVGVLHLQLMWFGLI